MIDFITKGAFDGAGLADTDGNFPLVHLLTQDFARIQDMRVGQPGFGGNDGNFRGHSPLLYLSLLKPRKPGCISASFVNRQQLATLNG